MSVLIQFLLALSGGLLLPFAFSPYDYPWLAPVCLSALFFTWQKASPWKAFALGYLFGLGQFGVGVSWIYNSLHDYGGASVGEGVGLTALGVCSVALHPALAGLISIKLSRRLDSHQRMLLVFPSVWILSEWVRASVIPGFAWLQLGSSQTDTVLGHGLAPVLGVYGVGLAVALLAGLALSVFNRNDRQRRVAMLGICLLIVVCAGLSRIPWTHPVGKPFKAALLQGNVPQDQKWLPEFQRSTLELYMGMSRQHWDAKLIIWPETAIPAFYQQVKDTWLAQLQEEALAHNTDVILGIPWADLPGSDYYNAMVTVGQTPGQYFKRHLVPFGEYLPFRFMLGWVLDILQIPLGDFARGQPGQEPMQAAGYPLAASICYEDVFGHEARDALPQAAYLVNVTNDAWFGDSMAPYQHIQMARMRTLESGRYMLRATNTGVTAIISSQGEILKQAPLFTRAIVTGDITPMAGTTPYIFFGDWLMLGGLSSLLVYLRFIPARLVGEE